MTGAERDGENILVLAPSGRDSALACRVLGKAGLSRTPCRNIRDLLAGLGGAGALLVTAEALSPQDTGALEAALARQPPWSDLPLILFSSGKRRALTDGLGNEDATKGLGPGRNVTLLERPVRPPTLVTVMRSALRARRRQYQVRDLLVQLEALNENLEERVRERTAELLSSNERLNDEVAERRRTEALLRESEARFFTAFRASPAATAIIRLSDLSFLDVNESFLRISEYERDEVVGQSAKKLKLLGEGGRALPSPKGPGGTVEARLHSKSGKVRTVVTSREVVTLKGEACLLESFLDITERKQTEEQLMQAIQAVMQDAAWFSRSVMEKLAHIRSGKLDETEVAELTNRERQVLELIAKGRSNEQIGSELGLAHQTVRNYTARVYEKLGLHSRAEAVIWARERGLSGFGG